MSWRNVKLIYAREIRDQLRDRRTLFMIAVLPLLFYPLLGMSVFQLSQFLRKNESRVLLVGTEQVTSDAELPPLLQDGHFADDLFDDPAESGRLILEIDTSGHDASQALDAARVRLKSGDVQAVVYFPPDFTARLEQLRTAAKGDARPGDATEIQPIDVPQPEVVSNNAREKSRLAEGAVRRVIENWKAQVVRQNLLVGRVPKNIAKPFQVQVGRRGRAAAAGSGRVGQDRAVRAVHLGADRGVLSGGRPLRGREGTGHARNAALEPGAAKRNRLGQAAHGDDLQHCHGVFESHEPRHYGAVRGERARIGHTRRRDGAAGFPARRRSSRVC